MDAVPESSSAVVEPELSLRKRQGLGSKRYWDSLTPEKRAARLAHLRAGHSIAAKEKRLRKKFPDRKKQGELSDDKKPLAAMREFAGRKMMELITDGRLDRFFKDPGSEESKGTRTLLSEFFGRYLDVDAKTVAPKEQAIQLTVCMFADGPPPGWREYDVDREVEIG